MANCNNCPDYLSPEDIIRRLSVCTSDGHVIQLGSKLNPFDALAPSGLTATNTASGVELGWTNNSLNAGGVRVFVSTDNITFIQLGIDLAPNVVTYTHAVSDGILRYYKVAAFKNLTLGNYSNMVYEVGWVYFTMQSVQPATISQVSFIYRMYPAGNVWIDWGNGSTVQLSEVYVNTTITSVYVTNNTTYTIRIFGELACVKNVYFSNATLQIDFNTLNKLNEVEMISLLNVVGVNSSSINNLPATLKELTLFNLSTTVSGTIANLPRNLELLNVRYVQPNFTGSFSDLPTTLKYLYLQSVSGIGTQSFNNLPSNILWLTLNGNHTGSTLPANLVYCNVDSNAITVSIDSISKLLTYLSMAGCTNSTGDVKNLSSCLITTTITGCPNITVTSGQLPVWRGNTITIQDAWVTAEVDEFLNSWMATCGKLAKTINLAGTSGNANQPRSAASDAAVTDMQTNKLKTFVFNT